MTTGRELLRSAAHCHRDRSGPVISFLQPHAAMRLAK